MTSTSLCTQDAYTTHPRSIHGIRFTPRQSARRIGKRRAAPDCRRATTVSEAARRRHLQDGRDLDCGHHVRRGAVPTRSTKKWVPEGPVHCSRHPRPATHKMHTARTQDAPTAHPGFIQSDVTMATPHTHGTPIAPTSHTHHAYSTHSTRPPLDPFLLSPTGAPQTCASDTHGARTMHT